MKFTQTQLEGACIIDVERLEDERGFFGRSWCAREFQEHGLNPRLAQCSISFNRRRGTLRGMHFQVAPHEEAKIVRCTQGAIYDVIIDLRLGSPTFTRWIGVELSAENRRMLYVPESFAHGFQTLTDSSEVFYQISEFYAPESARGVRWNDPRFGIRWPLEVAAMSDKDTLYRDFDPAILI
jgi:dTDP-4-dehydrorhamnose 3,5-epimerase